MKFYADNINLAADGFTVVPAVIDRYGRFGDSRDKFIKDIAYTSASTVKERAYKTFQLRVAIATAHVKALSQEQLTMLRQEALLTGIPREAS